MRKRVRLGTAMAGVLHGALGQGAPPSFLGALASELWVRNVPPDPNVTVRWEIGMREFSAKRIRTRWRYTMLPRAAHAIQCTYTYFRTSRRHAG